ncbi:MAG: hypothetical protein JWO38_2811 [Gemmataceae bacterium]|nr:hypothetical protein [Gemmataceae bacterium]
MSNQTLRSLFDRISSERIAREKNAQALERATPFERSLLSMQIASSDQDLRNRLDSIDELPALLALVPRLQEGWPYPSEEAMQTMRAEVAHHEQKPVAEIDDLPLRDVVTILGGPPLAFSSQSTRAGRTSISGSDVAALPRWARVAFAARCARRVERILPEVAPQAAPDELEGIAQAVRLAEDSATTGKAVRGTAEASSQAFTLAERAKSSPRVNGKAKATSLSSLLRGTIESVAGTAAQAAEEDNPAIVFDAYLMAAQAGHALSSTSLLEGMLWDFEYLKTKSREESWTDETPVAPSVIPRPSLKLVGLHIRNLRAIRQLDLPKDGLGWGETVPDLMVLGGINGSGKTTLLQFIVAALELLTQDGSHNGIAPDDIVKPLSAAEEAWLEFEIQSYEVAPFRFRIVISNSIKFLRTHGGANYRGIIPSADGRWFFETNGKQLQNLPQLTTRWFGRATIPGVVLLPSEHRTLIVPGAEHKAAGKLDEARRFVHRWQPPSAWKDSLEAVLYSMRWEDLNAKEEGRFTEINHFAAYAEAFRRFTGDTKSLRFENGRLVVRIADTGATHELAELSSGERQALLLTGELLRYWRPGSLILIDEPELHLHTRWQTRLYESLRYWQKERGGQVIIATQSSHLATLAGAGTSVLLGVESL